MQGKKYLTFLFGLSPNVVVLLHNSIKSVMPYCDKNALVEYGEVRLMVYSLTTQ